MPQKTEINVETELKGEEAKQLLAALKEEAKPFKDKVSGAIAEEVVEQYIRALKENGSVVTGKGIDSIDSEHMSEGMYAVKMNDYLQQVDTGTSASERKPVELNDRLIAAGKQYGMRPRILQNILQNNGTRAHPFRGKAIERAAGKIDDIVKKELRKMMDDIDQK